MSLKMNDNSTKSSDSAPPISAFQGLVLTRRPARRRQRRRPFDSLSKTPIDPMDCLGIHDFDSDSFGSQSDITDDDQSSIVDEEAILCEAESLPRILLPCDMGPLEQACFAALCCLFFNPTATTDLPPPHRVVVIGLWANIVLPPLLFKADSDQIPELVAQDVWDALRTELQCITENDCNIVTVTNAIYNEHGQKMAKQYDTTMWMHHFAAWLQSSCLDGDQPYAVQLYALEVIIPYWISLGAVARAASLLHQPTYISKEWSILIREENPLQITQRHLKSIELYLTMLPPSASKWQQALGLYQGWHIFLRQEMQVYRDQAVDASSDRSQSSGTSTASYVRPRRSSRRPREQKRGDPTQLLLLGNSLLHLSSSLDSVLTDFPGQDAAVELLWRRQAEYLAEALHVLCQVEDVHSCHVRMRCISYVLSAKAWLSMSSLCAIAEESNIDDVVDIDAVSQLYDVGEIEDGETDEVRCLNVAKVLLATAEPLKKSPTLKLMFLSLKALLHDAWGRWLYNKQRYEEARLPLEDATKQRRQILALEEDTCPAALPFFWWSSAPMQESDDDSEVLCHLLCLHSTDTERQVQETEIALAQSLEYVALAFHACGMSMTAMSSLEQALVLKIIHYGKLSLELARLKETMATVMEDLLQWETALSRYRECLRIRMHVLGQTDPDEWFTSGRDLFHSILENLASMGRVYRMLGDHDNAVGCHWKIATLAEKEWESLRSTTGRTAFWGFDDQRRMTNELRTMPLPTLVLEEEQHSKTDMKISPPQSPPLVPKNDVYEADSILLSQSAQAYQTILRIFEEKAKIVSQTSTLAAAVSDEELPLLLVSSYRLGMIHIYFGDFRSAMLALEHCLSTLWVLEPSSSDSSSEDDEERGYFRENKRRQHRFMGAFGNEMQVIGDEGIYHALGICRAACGEHDQAVRFHMTALRCAKRVHGVNSIRASEVLYDAATSYWYLKEYEKAEELWSSCLQMRSFRDVSDVNQSGDDLSGFASIDDARIHYNIGAALCALGRYSEPRTEESLEKARLMFTTLLDSQRSVEVASCLFYLALLKLRKASSAGDILSLQYSSTSLNHASSIFKTLGYLRSWSDDETLSEPSLTNPALQAHCRYVEASISESLGNVHRALDIYNSALFLYRSFEDERWKIYVASVLNKIAKLELGSSRNIDLALVNFDEALRLRKKCLGDDHEAVADTLYHMAKIHSCMDNHSVAIEMYEEALRIQILAVGSCGAAVAMTLQMIASVYVRQGNFDLAMEKLSASLSIRKNRANLFDRASRVVSGWSGDLVDDFLAMSEEAAGEEANGHIRRTLQDDLIYEEIALAAVYHCMGTIWVRLGEYSSARECFEQSLCVRRSHPALHVMCRDGTTLLHVWDTLHNLACLYELQKDYTKAISYYTAALKLKHAVLSRTEGPAALNCLVDSHAACTENLAVDGRYLNSIGSVSYAMTLHRLGTVYFRIGDRNTATACLGSAVRIQRRLLGLHHFTVAKTLVDLACALRSSEGKGDEARTCYKEAYEIRKLRYRNDANVGHILYHIGQLYDAKNDYARASTFYYQAIYTYGRQHVDAVSRRICQKLFLWEAKAINDDDDDATSGDLLAKDGFRAASIEETDDMITAQFSTISRALRESARMRIRSMDNTVMMDLDVHAPDCLISLELYFFRLYELIQFLSGEYTQRTSHFAEHARRQFEVLGAEGMKTSKDAITFQMLCLIQD